MFKKIAIPLLTAIGFLFIQLCMAQSDPSASTKVEMAEGLRGSGKIYVVVVVLVTILTGIVIYLARLDRRITKLEQELTIHNLGLNKQ